MKDKQDMTKEKVLPIVFTDAARKNLMKIQAKQQLKTGVRRNLKVIASEILERAK